MFIVPNSISYCVNMLCPSHLNSMNEIYSKLGVWCVSISLEQTKTRSVYLTIGSYLEMTLHKESFGIDNFLMVRVVAINVRKTLIRPVKQAVSQQNGFKILFEPKKLQYATFCDMKFQNQKFHLPETQKWHFHFHSFESFVCYANVNLSDAISITIRIGKWTRTMLRNCPLRFIEPDIQHRTGSTLWETLRRTGWFLRLYDKLELHIW